MQASRNNAEASTERSPYPRPWWLTVPRVILAFLFVGGLFYPVALIQAIARHTALTTDRTLVDPHTLVWYLPLMGAGGWAIVDLYRESKALGARRRAARREPPERLWQRKLAAARTRQDRQAELEALSALGFWLAEEERYEEARPYLEEALSLARDLGDQPFREERALYGLGLAAFERRDQDTAEDLFRQCLAVTATLDAKHRDETADVYAHVGEFLCAYRDKREEGCHMLAQAQAIYHEIGQSRPRWLDDERRMRDLRLQYGDESI